MVIAFVEWQHWVLFLVFLFFFETPNEKQTLPEEGPSSCPTSLTLGHSKVFPQQGAWRRELTCGAIHLLGQLKYVCRQILELLENKVRMEVAEIISLVFMQSVANKIDFNKPFKRHDKFIPHSAGRVSHFASSLKGRERSRCCLMEKTREPGDIGSSLGRWPWGGHLLSLHFHYLICKVRIMMNVLVLQATPSSQYY